MEVAFDFSPLVASKLIIYTFGALVHLFLMVLVLGQRRLRRLEWTVFALMAALFMWNSGNLLALNVGLHFGVGPNILSAASRLIPFLGLILVPPLVVDVQEQYAAQFGVRRLSLRILTGLFYLPLAGAPWLVGMLLGRLELDPLLAIRSVARPIVIWAVAALIVGAAVSVHTALHSRGRNFVQLHIGLAVCQGVLAGGLAWAYLIQPSPTLGLGGALPTFLMFVAILPGIGVGYSIFRHNFLELRVQRNLVYSLVTIFALLIYLAGIRRLGTFLEGYGILPAVATESVMIFVLVIFLEPVKKWINAALRKAFVSEFERVQKLADEIQEFAVQSGDLAAVRKFVEDRAPAVLKVETVKLVTAELNHPAGQTPAPGRLRVFSVHRANQVVGSLEVVPVTSDLSGDQEGAIQLLADQLAPALKLCELIADKLRLEHELAEQAKMAFLGEMAARIAHNVKNPLSSMKTLVQLLGEDASLPERVRKECSMITGEIDRLNSNISQVLRYAKPARDTDRPADLTAVISRVVAVMRPEAERRGVSLELDDYSGPSPVRGGEEAASDIVSNLVVNALEASQRGGKVKVCVSSQPSTENGTELIVEDDGPGIPEEIRMKVFQPFFTTRAGGTGLGLAIVARRAEEIGGAAECLSPVAKNGGTRFVVHFCKAP